MSGDIDGSGWIKHRLTSDIIHAAHERHFNMCLSVSTRIAGCYTDVTSDGRTRTFNKKQPRMSRCKKCATV